MNSYFARQPIFSKRKNILAYEILYREGIENKFPISTPGDKATCSLLVNSFFNIDIFSVVNHKPIFINFPTIESLKKLTNFVPTSNVYIEILEDIEPTEELYQTLQELFHKGYRFVLDDFSYSRDWDRFFKFIKIVKFDVLETPLDQLSLIVKKIKKTKTKVLAEKIETHSQFKKAKKLGFDYFQGFFFAKPEVLENKIDPYKNSTILLLYRELLRENLNYNKIANTMYTDSSIAFKFFQYVSLVSKGKIKEDKDKKRTIDSIKSAIAYIGEDNTKNFIFLLSTANLSVNKPIELQKLSVTRAKFSQQIAKKSNLRTKSEGASIVGLFSCLEALLDIKMESIIKDINLDKEIKNALLNKDNDYTKIIEIFKNYEKGRWDKVEELLENIEFLGDIDNIYADSIRWTDQHFETL